MRYDVFISFKNQDEQGNPTEDSQIAAELFKELEQRGIHSFFSNIRLFEFGEAAYKEAIETALEESRVLVALSTDVKYLKSQWVSYERESFHEDILSGRKKNAFIVPYLKNISGTDVPRSLRSYETFIIGVTPLNTVIEFIIKCLQKHEEFKDKKFEKSLVTGKVLSRYSPDKSQEFRRLAIQAKNTRAADMPAIRYALQQLNKKERITILDAGCAWGYVTYDRFATIKNAFILGVDISEKCINYAKEHHANPQIQYELLNLEEENLEIHLEELMAKYQIEKFDIIFSSLVLHHLKNPNKFLRRIRRYLSQDGFIILRGSDDGSMVACNDDGLIEKIVELHLKADGISDRFNGRKIYAQLSSSGYKNIKMMNYVKDISGLDIDDRYDVFIERFSYRRNYLEENCKDDPYNMEKRNALEAMDFALDRLENKFSEETFWYCEVDFVGIAQRK